MTPVASSERALFPPPIPVWSVSPPPDSLCVASLEKSLSLPRAACSLLSVRGFDEPEAAKAFLRPLLGGLCDPFDLRDMRSAVDRILHAVAREETILVHGDYDADGICGAALLTRWLRRLGARVEPFVPERIRDGYDFGEGGLARALEVGAGLVVTVDCGVRAHDTVRRAARKGVDVVVTDHHAPGEDLPPAVAVVNPSRADCASSAGPLSGTGVAYKVCQALARERGIADEELHPHLDLVALATVADLVPLQGENRTLVRYGMKALRRSVKRGLRALFSVTGLEPDDVDAGKVGFVLAPRINAAGRVGESRTALRLLLTSDEDEALELAGELEETNGRRKEEDRRILGEALEQLAASYDPARDFGVVLASRGWHPGVIGIVASRIVERIHRPVVLIALDGGRGRGSARSIPGLHLARALERCAGHLIRYGGHERAAGMDLDEACLDDFRSAFQQEARKHLRDSPLRPELRIDLEVDLEETTQELHRYLEYFGPFGMSNRRPVFVARGVRCAGRAREVGSGHLKLQLVQNGCRLDAIGFGLAERVRPEQVGERAMDVVFQLRQNSWRGRRTLEARLLDLRLAGEEGA